MNADPELPVEIDPQPVKGLLDASEEFLFLDCRVQDEYDFAHIAGTTLIPMSQIAERISELESHRDLHIVVLCHHGVRSLRVTHWLRNQGFTKSQSLAGGIDMWSQAIDQSIPRY